MEIDIYDSGCKTCKQGEEMNRKALINKQLSDLLLNFISYVTRKNGKSLVNEMGKVDRQMKSI